MAGIFVLYRRPDEEQVRHLSRHLGCRFGDDLVLCNADGIAGGEKWHERVEQSMAVAEVVLAIIGPDWVDMSDALRGLLADALKQNMPILAVLVGGAEMPDRKDFPEDIAPLADHPAADLRDASWTDDIGRLLERVRDMVRPGRERAPLYSIQLDVCRLQEDFSTALNRAKDAAGALEVSRRIFDLLNRTTPLYPADIILLSSRGHAHRSVAAALAQLDRAEERERHLSEAGKVFAALLEEYPLEPAAWDGKGSVELMLGNLDEALRCFDQALKLSPVYEEALQNRETVLAELEKRGA